MSLAHEHITYLSSQLVVDVAEGAFVSKRRRWSCTRIWSYDIMNTTIYANEPAFILSLLTGTQRHNIWALLRRCPTAARKRLWASLLARPHTMLCMSMFQSTTHLFHHTFTIAKRDGFIKHLWKVPRVFLIYIMIDLARFAFC